MRNRLLVFLLVLSLAGSAFAGTNKANLLSLAHLATSENPGEAAAAIRELRAQGPAGLEAFMATYGDAIETRRREIVAVSPVAANAAWLRVSAALDAIAGQKDDFASGLYWYTDFEQAREAAQQSGKPILSLRLLGRLDEELSCANSRFFRLTLYPNREVAKILKERFILHWQSVRPVPKVTIDFGDGRKLERTLTGNSIHYVLDSRGRVVDALPGLYGPQAFRDELLRAASVAVQSGNAPTDAARTALLRGYHNTRLNEVAAAWSRDTRLNEIAGAWSRDMATTGGAVPLPKPTAPTGTDTAKPRAEVAARGAMTKMVLAEKPVLRGMSPEPRLLDTRPEDTLWARIAALHADRATLDADSRALIRSKSPERFAINDELQRTLAALERAIAIDTVRNEYLFHNTLHQWLAQSAGADDLAALNERVYAELFLTPSSDKWLGLFPSDSFTGIENDGMNK